MNFLKEKIENDSDFINLKRFDFSLKKLLERHPNGVSDRLISQALSIGEAEITQRYQQILLKLKKQLSNDE
jgi:hypothetical protein